RDDRPGPRPAAQDAGRDPHVERQQGRDPGGRGPAGDAEAMDGDAPETLGPPVRALAGRALPGLAEHPDLYPGSAQLGTEPLGVPSQPAGDVRRQLGAHHVAAAQPAHRWNARRANARSSGVLTPRASSGSVTGTTVTGRPSTCDRYGRKGRKLTSPVAAPRSAPAR